MKVLHINTHNTGGAAIACLRIHRALLDEGVHSKVLLRNKTKLDTPHVYEVWEDLSILQKAKKLTKQTLTDKKNNKLLPSELTELFTFPNSIWDITENEHYKEADIIHLHWVAGFVDFPSFFKKCDKKIIWTLHDYAPFSGGFHYPTNQSNHGVQNLINTHLRLKENALKNIELNIVSPSKYLMNQSKKSSLFSNYNHSVISNPVSNSYKFYDKLEARKKLNIPLDAKVVLFVADNIDYKRKGLNLLLDAIKYLEDKSIQYYILGKGETSKSKQIHYLGEISDEIHLNKIYAAADLFVIPSLDDNLPNTISESLCSGTPVVGFKIGGIPEMINSNNGDLCKEISSECLSQTIKVNIEKDWKNLDISNTAKQKYDSKTCANLYLSYYNSARDSQ